MTWAKIKQCKSYSINELGEVRNDTTGRLKKPSINKSNGYMYVDLWENNRPVKMTVHRLVAEAFIPNPENKPTVDHKDGNRANNSIDNLRWASYAEQNSRFHSTGVRSERVKVMHFAEKRRKRGGGHEAWMNVDNVMHFDRIKDAADHFGVTASNISLLLKTGTIGRRGKTRGYLFEYANGKRSTFVRTCNDYRNGGEAETE